MMEKVAKLAEENERLREALRTARHQANEAVRGFNINERSPSQYRALAAVVRVVDEALNDG